MNLDRVEKIAEAVLYEGYMLYPYRPSSVKNQQRWNFGVLYPSAWCNRQSGSDRSSMTTECLLQTTSSTRLTVKVRFLQIVQRSVAKLHSPLPHIPGIETPEGEVPSMEIVDCLEVAGRVHHPWQEAVEREVICDSLDPRAHLHFSLPFSFPQGTTFEYLRDDNGTAVGVIVRESQSLLGEVKIQSERCRDAFYKVAVEVQNLALPEPQPSHDTRGRDAVLLVSLVSAHTILGADDGEFISLLDPPPDLKNQVANCKNVGTWPVLAGDGPTAVLSSPIILYDYPQIAPQSAGNLFDSTEIDEILSLRILTLTDAEKTEMRQSDDLTRGILERTENMPEEQFMKLHGILRGLSPAKEKTQ